jgi:DNA helicase-2/ATP-dependent DNA helicase PcrA
VGEERVKMSLRNVIAATAITVAVATKEVLLKGLNPEQKAVVEHDNGPLLVAAVAGSGKTHALVNRVGYLVKVRKINPRRVLAVTFSRKGADEMNERLFKLIGESGARVGTFHSLAYQILREEGLCEGWEVDARDRYRYCIKDATGFRHMKWTKADVTLLSHFISLCKCNLARPDSEKAIEIAHEIRSARPGPSTNVQKMLEAYETAEEIRHDRMLLTFDDMLFDACEYFSTNENARKKWASRWDYVLQDEAQDQNLGQLLLGELLAKDHRNYMIVGDPAQTIFTWRGAKPEKLLGFEKEWNAKKIIMNRNYRCGQEVIDIANNVLHSMDPEQRLDTDMVCELGTNSDVTCFRYTDLDDEGEGIALKIQELIADKEYEPRDIAILYRTNAQSRAPEENLISERIPYRIIGGTNFYERREVKDLLAYLRLAEGRGNLDDVARSINTPFRFLGKAFVEKVRNAAKNARAKAKKAGGRVSYPGVVRAACDAPGIQQRQKDSADDWADLIERAHNIINNEDSEPPARILEDIVRATRYTEWLVRDEGEESPENSRVSNVRELIRAATRFPTTKELLDYIDKTVKANKDQKKKEGKAPNKVTLTTLHRSKGMEWPVVFVIGASDDILPHKRCEDIEEERRLFYVGCTRAMKQLHISSIEQAAIGNRLVFLSPSIFISEAGLTPQTAHNTLALGDPHDV